MFLVRLKQPKALNTKEIAPAILILMDAFLLAVDRENGSLHLDPLDVLSYPYKTTQALTILQATFMEHIAELNKNAAKSRTRQPARAHTGRARRR